jgi:restriction system protein
MTVPTWEQLMLPGLRLLSDRNPRRIREIEDAVAIQLGLSSSDREELLPSGTAGKFDNRVRWALKDLLESGLLERPERGVYRITARGLNVLEKSPKSIDRDFLLRFPEFQRFQSRSQPSSQTSTEEKGDTNAREKTPIELIESGSAILRHRLRNELLDKVKSASPRFFEQLVVDLLVAMGYGGSKIDTTQALVVGKSGDEGIDGIIKEDKLGLDVIYIQAKRWADASVGRPTVQGFVGSLEGKQATKGIMLTTSKYSGEAREYVRHLQKKIVLIDGDYLADLMIDNQIGVSGGTTYTVRQIDEDYFQEE